jgi:hypothetical protein
MSDVLGLFPGEAARPLADPLPTTPRTFGERFDLEYENHLSTGLFASRERNLFVEIDREIDAARAAGLTNVPGNWRRRGGFNLDSAYIGAPLLERQATLDAAAEARAAWDEWAAQQTQGATNGGTLFLPATAEELERRAQARAAALWREAQAAGTVGGGGFGGFLGTVAGAFSDPINIATLPLGAPVRALRIAEGLAVSAGGRAGARIAATAAGEGIAAGLVQAGIETRAAPYRVEIGLPDTFGDNVIEAAIGGAVLGGGLRGLVEGWRVLRGRVPAPNAATARAEQDAARLAEEQILADARQPGGPETHRAHTAAADSAMDAITAGRLPGAAVEPPPPPRYGGTRNAIAAEEGQRFNAFTPSGRAVMLEPQVVELDSLIPSHLPDGTLNPAFPHAEGVQPRDRGAAPSQDQVRTIAAQLVPERLLPNREAGFGAPIVAADQVVESGNGRVLALLTAYSDPTLAPQAETYRQALRASGYDIDGYRQPVLVSRRVSALAPAERAQFVREANGRANLDPGAAETAARDAERMAPALELWRGGDLDAAANAPFVRRFLQDLTPEERGAFLTADGRLSSPGQQRIAAALFARAYGDELGALLPRFLETQATGFRDIAGALQDVAGDWSRMRALAADGRIDPAADATPHLAAAIRALDDARTKKIDVQDYVLQGDLDRPPLPDNALAFLATLHRDVAIGGPLASRKALRERLAGYIAEAEQRQAGPDLFGDGPPPVGATALATARRVADDAAPPATQGAPVARGAADAPPGAGAETATAVAPPTFRFDAEARVAEPMQPVPNLRRQPDIDPATITRERVVEASRAAEATRAAPGAADGELAEARRLAAASDVQVARLEGEAPGTVSARDILDEADDAVTHAAEAGACLIGAVA